MSLAHPLERLVSGAVASNPALGVPPCIDAAAPRPAWSRHLTAYVAHVGNGLSRPQVASIIGRSKPAVTWAVRRIEDARDDEAFDQAIEQLCMEARGIEDAQEECARRIRLAAVDELSAGPA